MRSDKDKTYRALYRLTNRAVHELFSGRCRLRRVTLNKNDPKFHEGMRFLALTTLQYLTWSFTLLWSRIPSRRRATNKAALSEGNPEFSAARIKLSRCLSTKRRLNSPNVIESRIFSTLIITNSFLVSSMQSVISKFNSLECGLCAESSEALWREDSKSVCDES